MTDEELNAIEARAAAATPGPWWVYDDGRSAGVVNGDGSTYHRPYRAMICGGDAHEGYFDGPDADFIAHARTDVPALVAEVRRLTQLLADVFPGSDCIEE